MTPVRLEPAALRSRVKHSTTEPLQRNAKANVPAIFLDKRPKDFLKLELCKKRLFNKHIILIYKLTWGRVLRHRITFDASRLG